MIKKRVIRIITVAVVVVVLIGGLSVFSFVKFGTANFISTSCGICKVMLTDTEWVVISQNPTIIIGKPNATIDGYMMENGGYILEADKQLGAMYVYSNGDNEVHIMYSANGYYAKWIWQD